MNRYLMYNHLNVKLKGWFYLPMLTLLLSVGFISQTHAQESTYSLKTEVANSSTGLGIIKLNPAGGNYAPGTVVTVTVVTSQLSTFGSWTGDATGTSPTINVTMNSNKSISAVLNRTIPAGKIALDYLIDGPGTGTVTLNPAGGIYDPETPVVIKANAGVNSAFSHWGGGDLDNTLFGIAQEKNILVEDNNLYFVAYFDTPSSVEKFNAHGNISEHARGLRYKGSEVFVRFDQLNAYMTFSLPGFNAILVQNENDGRPIAQWNGMVETHDHDTSEEGFETTMDGGNIYSRIWLESKNDARIVVRYRSAPVNFSNQLAHTQLGQVAPYGPGDHVDEWFTIYPDGSFTREVKVWSPVAAQAVPYTDDRIEQVFFETQEFLFNASGVEGERELRDDLNTDALTLVDMTGRTQDFSYDTYPVTGHEWEELSVAFAPMERANMVIINTKSELRPYTVGRAFERGESDGNFVSCYPNEWAAFNPPLQVPTFNEWPVGPDMASGYIGGGLGHMVIRGNNQDWFKQEGTSVTKIYLSGVVNHTTNTGNAAVVKDIGRSWLTPPVLSETSSTPAQVYGYDMPQKAYLVDYSGVTDTNAVTFQLNAGNDSPMVNPAFLINNWGAAKPIVEIDGTPVTAATDLKFGFYDSLDVKDGRTWTNALIVWIQRKSKVPVTLKIYSSPTYTVTYNGNGQTGGTTPVAQTKAQDIDVTLSDNSGNLVKFGFHFAGWNTSPDGSGTYYGAGTSYSANSNLPLFAQWSAVPVYPLIVNNGSGSGSYSAGTVVPLVANVSSNSSFVNWTGDTAGVGSLTSPSTSITMPAVAVTLTANSAVKTYTVTFSQGANGFLDGDHSLVQNVYHGNSATAPFMGANPGYTFTGWDKQFTNVTSDLTVTAQYALAHQVTFVLGTNGTRIGGGELTQQVIQGTAALAPVVVGNTGYIFTGWNVQFTNITAPLTVTAQYTTGNITVTFDPHGGSTPNPATLSVNQGSAYGTLPTTSLTGVPFSGWFTAATGGTQVTPFSIVTATADHTLYARWETVPTHTLTVNNGSGSGSYAVGTVVNISANVPGGQHFVNWTGDTANLADSNNASTTVTMPASTVTVTANFASGDTPHSADTNSDWSISQAEINTFITSYNNNSNTATTANGDITANRITMREVMRVIYLNNNDGAYIGGQGTVDTYDIVAAQADYSPAQSGAQAAIDEGDGNLVVSSNADSGVGSLRDAIAMAGYGETVIIDDSIDTITVLSEIVIDKSIIIDGQGAAIVSGDNATRIFRIQNDDRDIDVTLKNMGITDAENAADEFGGAIYNNGETLTLDTVLLDGNANSAAHQDGVQYGKGGAVYSSGTLNTENCVFRNNEASEENDVYQE